MNHLDDNAASEFVSGTLSASALGKVESHLAGCRECRALVAALAADTGDDSSAATLRHERLSLSQAAELPRKTLSIGDRVGRYLVLSPLGAGGMGVVFAAWDPQLGRKIALKLLRSGLAGSSKDARARLRREAQAIAQLSHPNVVSVYDVGTTDDGDLYIAMEFVEGDTLTTWLKKYPRTWREIIDVFLQAARGLLSAHGVGLLHRDFKPDNVLVGGDGRVRVTDFGLARSLLAPEDAVYVKPEMAALNSALTATGTVLGTPRYMPPEQLTGADPDARSDQFSFCVALYEALYGKHPLRDGTSVRMLEHGERALPPPEGTRLPAAIGRAVLRGLERDRAKRFPSMGSLIEELVQPPPRSPVRYARGAVAAAVLIGGTTAAVVVREPPRSPVTSGSRVEQLTQELGRKESQLRELLARLETRLDNERVDKAELARLRTQVQEKEAEIQHLVDQVAQLQAVVDKRPPVKQPVALAGPPQPAQATLVLAAVDAAQRPIEGCFTEWADRNQGTRDEVPEAILVVGLTITPEGVGTTATIVSTPDKHPVAPTDDGVSGRSILELCVSEQVVRVRFPPGPEQLELEAQVHWWSTGRVTLTSRVVGHHQVPRHQIELP
ncbi:MAG TPA: protein kinase [Kofleriaceae bacterium]|nr:protein kinase [Kofleriaceae bacterium]